MILKLVYNKEIHVYDLKSGESLDCLIFKVKELFRKLPLHFYLCYKSANDEEISFENNEDFDQLINSLKADVKMFKIFIKEKQIQNSHSGQVKSEQKLEASGLEMKNQQSQPVVDIKEIEENEERFGNIDQVHKQIQQQIAQSQKTQQIEDQNKKMENQFQNLQIAHENQPEEKIEQRESSERQIPINSDEKCDPQQLRKSSSNEEKQSFQNSITGKNTQEIEKPSIWELSEELSIKNQNKKQESIQIFKPISQQKIAPNFSQKINQHVPEQKQLIEDDFRSHNAKCDICNAFPICGARYMCVLCKNYDLCEKCQEKHSHDHPLLKIMYTFQTPLSIHVEIPELTAPKKTQIKIERIDLKKLTSQQRNERTLSLASEISELLGKEINDCYKFIRQNEEYTKQTIIQMLIDKDFNQAVKHEKSSSNDFFGFKNYLGDWKKAIFK